MPGTPPGVNDEGLVELVIRPTGPLRAQAGGAVIDTWSFADERQTYTVVGVTADLVSTQMGNPRPQLFISLAQHPASMVLAIARGTTSDPSVRHAFENAITNAHPDFVPDRAGTARKSDVITGEGLVDDSQRDLLTQSAFGGVLADVALVLAALGVYGVIAFIVATRAREIGVRVALGRPRTRVLRDVLGDALKLVVPEIGVGLALSVLWARVTLLRADELLKTSRALGRGERERVLPDPLVVDDAFAPAFHFHLLIRERLSPEVDPDVIKEQKDQLVMIALERHTRSQSVSQFVNKRPALCRLRVAGAQKHRTSAAAREADALINTDLDRPFLEL